MTLPHEAPLLLAGVGAVLVIATGVGQVLAWRFGKGPTIVNLNLRIYAWWVMAALIGGAVFLGKAGMIALFGFVSLAALREFATLTHTRKGDHWALLVAFLFALPFQYYLLAVEWYGLFSIFIPVYAFLALPIVAALRGDATRFLERIAYVQWGLMVCVFCLSHAPALMTLQIPGYGERAILLVAFLIIVVQGSDVLQYICGKLFGHRKIAPELSPSKTWEGLIGGVALATALGASLWWITPFTPLVAAAMAFVICMMGFLGGLVMSAIKRDRGVKDWGSMIEGHGGMLDRVDSVIFAAPVFFHLTRYWFTP
jgi:phosphatidate cytidylyltransferase